MLFALHVSWRWLVLWMVIALLLGMVVVRMDISARRESFLVQARTMHAALSRHAAQHDAMLATLALLGPDKRSGARVPAIYPQILAALRRDSGGWEQPGLEAAEAISRQARRPEPAGFNPLNRRYFLVLAADPTSHALHIDVGQLIGAGDWPIGNDPAMQIHLVHHSEHMVLQRGLPDPLQPFGLTEGFVFEKQLHSTSQPFTLRILRPTGPADWPWRWLAAIGIAMGVLVAAVKTGIDNWRARQRAESLLRIGQVARLNTLGELAGGMAHELNQPLSAVITNAQAAQRLLDDDPPEVDAARGAMAQAAAQGRRAAVVVARLRRRVETPAMAADIQPVLLDAVVARVLHLLEPELTKLAVRVSTDYDHLSARADVVALEQIVHNLLTNAMHSLDGVNPASRQLWVVAAPEMGHAVLTVTDNGPGLSEEALLRCFEPFYTTRPDGLGLGLSLCAALAESMHGQLSVRNDPPRGAQFRLQLPLAAQ